MDNPPLIQCKGLCRHFGSGPARTMALKNIDLSIEKGEEIALVGPSGSGKSTLLQIMGAMDLPDEGDILFSGISMGRMTDQEAARFRRNTVGFVFQFFNLIPTLSILDNVALPAQLKGLNRESSKERAKLLLTEVRLADRLEDYPDALSGGQQQRVAIARALVNLPQVVLADEPTGALDRTTSAEIIQILARMARKHEVTLVIATHDTDVMASMGRVIRIEDGTIVSDSTNDHTHLR